MKETTLFLALVAAIFFISATDGRGQCTFNGSITNTDLTHPNALNSSGHDSTVEEPQECPGIFTTTGPIHYDRYLFANLNGIPTDYTVSSDAAGCSTFLFGVTYITSFDPNSLCDNYLASMGSGYSDIGTYSFTVPTGGIFSVLVEEFDPSASCASYSVTVSPCPSVATPTPTGTPTATVSATPTNTPTSTPTGTPPPAISGIVTYGNAIGAPTPRSVSNVQVSGAGSSNVSTTTSFPDGTYSLTGFGSGSYTVTPTKTGGQNGITSFDAARISQHVAGVSPLTGSQLVVADVSGNGSISSFDAAEVASYVVATPPFGTTGNWIFTPANRGYASVTTNVTGQDYSALLMGEVSGNWSNTGPRPDGSRQMQSAVTRDDVAESGGNPESGAAVTAPHLITPADYEVIVPISAERVAGKGIISYEFDLRYDPAVIQPHPDPVDLAGTLSSKLSFAANTEETGLLKVAVYGPIEIDGDGIILNLRFAAIGAPGSASQLTFERIMINEGDTETKATDGQIVLSAAAPNEAEISGRLLTAMGEGIAHARVTLTDTTGQSRWVVSNGFGVYRFGGLQVGRTYTLRVNSKRFNVTQHTLSVSGQAVNADMIAEQ